MLSQRHRGFSHWLPILVVFSLLAGMLPPNDLTATTSESHTLLVTSAQTETPILASPSHQPPPGVAADQRVYLPMVMHQSVPTLPIETLVRPGETGGIGSADGRVRATFSSASVTQATRVRYQSIERPLITTPDLAVGGPAFAITAQDEANSAPVTQFPHDVTIIPATADKPATSIITPSITIQVRYTDADVWGLDEGNLTLYTRETPDDSWQPIPSAAYPEQNVLVAEVDHLSEFVPMARLAVATPSQSVPRMALDPDDNDGTVFHPGDGLQEEIVYNWRLAKAVEQRFVDNSCGVDIIVTRNAEREGDGTVSESIRAQRAQAHASDIAVTLAFNTLRGFPWGNEYDGGPVGYARTGNTADVELVNKFYSRIAEYTTRSPNRAVVSPILHPEFTSFPGTYAHIEALFLDHRFDWPIINTDFVQVVDGVYAALAEELDQNYGVTCSPPGSSGPVPPPLPPPPSAEQIQRWRDLGYQNYESYGGDPVSFSTGNHIMQVHLFRILSRGGLDLDFTLTYNAQDGRDDLFGYGWTFPYNARAQRYSDNAVSIVLPDGRTYHYTRNGDGYDAPAGVFDTLEDTSVGWEWTTQNHEQTLVFQETITGLGILTEQRDRRGNVLHFEYDLSGQDVWQDGREVPRPSLTAVRDDAGRTITVQSDDDGHITKLTLPDGREFDFAYTDGNLTAITDANTPTRGTRRFQYDERHRITHEWDEEGLLYLQNFYDDRDRVEKQIDADGVESFFAYDPTNGVMSFTDNEGGVWRYFYDNLNRVIAEEDPLSQTLYTEYDPDYNVTKATDARGNTTHYSYDVNGNLTERRDPLAGCSVESYTHDVTRWTYNEYNQVTSMTDALGNTWRYTYDDQGNLTRTEAPSGATEAIYNVWGQPTSITDANGHTTNYEYDSYGNLIKTIDAAGKESTSSYDIVGRELTYTDANNHTVEFTYDGNDNITHITDPKDRDSTFEYDRNDLLLHSTDRRGVTRDYRYDANLKLIAERDHPDGHWLEYSYDKLYRRTVMTDTLGFETRYAYDQIGQLTIVTDTLDHPTRYAYDQNGNLTAVTDPLNGQTTMSYDALDRLATITDAAGNRTEYCYDAEDRLTRTIGPRDGEVYSYEYDALDRLITITDPQGNVRRMAYDPVGNRIAEIDPLDHRTDYRYDELDRLITVAQPTLPDGARPTTQFAYDPVGNTLVITSPRGFATTFTYDANDNPTTITDPQGGRTSFTYDEEDNPLSITDANGHATTTTYDPVGNPLTITDGLGYTTRMEYDPAYNLVRLINAESRATVYEYDPMQRLTRETDPLGYATVYKRDAMGRVTAVEDANGHTTGYGYDPLDRLVAVTDALGHPTRYAYDEAGNLISITDANNHTTGFEYSLLDQLLAETNPLGETWRYAYDPAGRLTRRIDAMNRPTSYEHDSNDRLVGIQYGAPGPVQPPVTFDYDLDGNQTQMCDGLGCTSHTYDALGQQTSTTDWLGRSVRRSYDGVGNTVGMVYPNDWRVQYEYDANNRMIGLTDPRGETSSYKYNRLGQVTNIQHPNDTVASFDYDAANRLTGIDNRKRGAAQPQSAYTYALDKVGNRVQVSETRAAFDGSDTLVTLEHNYAYDALDRLVRASTELAVDGRSLPTSDERETTYDFDEVGNRLEQSGSVLAPDTNVPELPVAPRPEQTTYRYNEANQLLAAEGTAFRYNANGARTRQSRVLPNGATETTDYRYDREDRLIEVTKTVDGVVTMEAVYEYDGYGRRARKTVSYPSDNTPDQVITYLYDGLEIIGAQIEQGDDTSESYYYLAPSPITGLRRPVEMQNLASGERHWYQSDGLDSIIALTDESGEQVSPFLYGDYGQMLAGATDLQIFTYTAQDHDPETGLLHFYARYYDPATGTWLTQDAYRGDGHRYSYTNNSPLKSLDILGYKSCELWNVECMNNYNLAAGAAIYFLSKSYDLAASLMNHYLAGEGGNIQINPVYLWDDDATMSAYKKLWEGIISESEEASDIPSGTSYKWVWQSGDPHEPVVPSGDLWYAIGRFDLSADYEIEFEYAFSSNELWMSLSISVRFHITGRPDGKPRQEGDYYDYEYQDILKDGYGHIPTHVAINAAAWLGEQGYAKSFKVFSEWYEFKSLFVYRLWLELPTPQPAYEKLEGVRQQTTRERQRSK